MTNRMILGIIRGEWGVVGDVDGSSDGKGCADNTTLIINEI